MYDTDVLIVGCGPTGLTLAATLAARAVDAITVDGQPAGANTSRAAAVNARTLEVLHDLDVSRRLVKEGLQLPRFAIKDRGKTLIDVDFTTLPTEYPYTLALPQSITERVLRDRVDDLGGTMVRPRTLVSVAQDTTGVTATFRDGGRLRARYVVGADGIHSVVRHQAGIGFGGHEYPEAFVLADIRLTGTAPVDEVILFAARAGLTVLVPLPGGTFRVVAPLANAPESPDVALVQRLLDTCGYGPGRSTVDEVVWGSRFRIHHRVADTYRRGRLLLAGDAAHVHSPAGGQGMNLGIQDAVALGNALAAVLDGAPEALLDDYGTTRRPFAQQVLTLTSRLTRVATAPPAVRPLRNAGLRLLGAAPAARRGLAWRLSGLVYR